MQTELTSPDPDLQLRFVQVLHIVSEEPVEQVADQRLEHHGSPEVDQVPVPGDPAPGFRFD